MNHFKNQCVFMYLVYRYMSYYKAYLATYLRFSGILFLVFIHSLIRPPPIPQPPGPDSWGTIPSNPTSCTM